jgi:polyhydroxybutyrate depolymerase
MRVGLLRAAAGALALAALTSCQDLCGDDELPKRSDVGEAGASGIEGASTSGSGSGASVGTQGAGTLGCGSARPLKSGNYTENIGGAPRTYVVDVPIGYDTDKTYRLIFVWHPLGGSASQVVNGGYNGLKSLANNTAIFVAADGLIGSNWEASGTGWWNVDDRDIRFLMAMLYRLTANLCIDQDRIFSTGFSFGGMMSYTVGYELRAFRAVAPCSGDLLVIPHEETFTDALPIMAFHGNTDPIVTPDRGWTARDKYLTRNHCGTRTEPVAPSPCVQYQGCDVPTIWCEFRGGHQPWSEEPQAMWKLFSQF